MTKLRSPLATRPSCARSLSFLVVLPSVIWLAACQNENALPGGAGGSSTTAGTGGKGGSSTTSGAGGSSTTAGSGGTSGNGGTTGGVGAGGASATGQGGASGGGGAGGSTSAGPACGAGTTTVPGGGASFPFPQNRRSPACTFPTACNGDDAAAGWQKYKARLIVDGGSGTLRVQRPENSNDSVSEGIAYGMLFAVYFNDKTTFDGLWAYEQARLDPMGLMNWHYNSDGSIPINGKNSATDSDEDMAFALVMADKQWGGYTTVAKDFIGKVAAGDFGADGTIKGGDTYVAVNPSYLAPAFYRAFASYTGDARWTTILEKTYALLAGAANATTGLVPDWSTGGRGPTYTYDATRTPFRVALDACWNNEPRAVAFSQKIGGFFAGIGASNIKDGYNLDGTVTGMYTNSAFVGPAGVAGMAANQATLVADAYTRVSADAKAGTDSYYNLSWALFSTTMMTGNFVDLSH